MNRPLRPSSTDHNYYLGISVEEHITTEITKKLLDHVANPQTMPDSTLEELVNKASVIARAIIKKS